jgi:hypothetical protein
LTDDWLTLGDAALSVLADVRCVMNEKGPGAEAPGKFREGDQLPEGSLRGETWEPAKNERRERRNRAAAE